MKKIHVIHTISDLPMSIAITNDSMIITTTSKYPMISEQYSNELKERAKKVQEERNTGL